VSAVRASTSAANRSSVINSTPSRNGRPDRLPRPRQLRRRIVRLDPHPKVRLQPRVKLRRERTRPSREPGIDVDASAVVERRPNPTPRNRLRLRLTRLDIMPDHRESRLRHCVTTNPRIETADANAPEVPAVASTEHPAS
jgi:hypothetical protein